jgi:hypothetical protein
VDEQLQGQRKLQQEQVLHVEIVYVVQKRWHAEKQCELERHLLLAHESIQEKRSERQNHRLLTPQEPWIQDEHLTLEEALIRAE